MPVRLPLYRLLSELYGICARGNHGRWRIALVCARLCLAATKNFGLPSQTSVCVVACGAMPMPWVNAASTSLVEMLLVCFALQVLG